MRIRLVLVWLIQICMAAKLEAFDTLNVAISSAPNNLIPFYSTDANSQNINRLLHVSLIDFNSKMQVECKACESFIEKVNGTKHSIKFKLKKTLTFLDGTPLTASDVVLSWKYFAKNNEIKSTFMGDFEAIEDVLVISPYEVEFIFSHFALENLSNLAMLKILKLKTTKLDQLELSDIVGAGEYKIGNLKPLEIELIPINSNALRIVFKVVKDETTLALKLLNREIDLSVASISPRKVEWLKNQDSLQVWDRASTNFLYMGLNHKREIFKNLQVRKAMSLLIPREELLKYKLKNTAVLSNGMFSPAFVDFYSERSIDPYDLEKAEQLFIDAGLKKDSRGFLTYKGVPLELEWIVSNNKSSIEMVEVLKFYFQKAGVKINVSVKEWGTFMAAFKAGKFDIIMGQWVGFSGPQMLKYVYHSKSLPPKAGNRIGYSNKDFDHMIDMATVEPSEKKRKELYKKAYDIEIQDYASINLWHPNIIWIGQKCLENIEIDGSGSFYPLLSIKKQKAHCEAGKI